MYEVAGGGCGESPFWAELYVKDRGKYCHAFTRNTDKNQQRKMCQMIIRLVLFWELPVIFFSCMQKIVRVSIIVEEIPSC